MATTDQYKIDLEVAEALRDLKKFLQGMQKTRTEVEKTDKTTKTFGKSLLGLKSAVAAIAGAGGLGAVVKSSLSAADNLGKVANKVGLTVEELQKLRYVAEQSGVATKTFDVAMQRFSRRVGEAANGSGVLFKTLKEIGIATRDASGNVRPLNELFDEYIRAIDRAGGSQEKLRLAFQAFDSEGANLVNVLQGGIKGYEGLRKEAEKLPTITQQQADAATRANDAWGRVRIQFQRIAQTLSVQLAPALEEVGNKISTALADPDRIQRLSDAFVKLSDYIIKAADAVGFLVDHLGSLAKAFAAVKIAKWLGVFDSFKGSLANLTSAFTKAGPSIAGLGALFTKAIGPALGLVARVTAIGTAVWALTEALQGNIPWLNKFLQDIGLLGRTTEEQIKEVERVLAGGWDDRLRFFGPDGLIEYYDDAELNRILESLRAKLAEENKIAADAAAKMAETRKQQQAALDAIAQQTNNAAGAFDQYGNSVEAAAEKVRNAFGGIVQYLPKTAQAQYEYAQAAEKLKAALDIGAISTEQYEEALRNAQVALSENVREIQKLEHETSALGKAQAKAKDTLEDIASTYKPILTKQQQLTKDVAKLTELYKKGLITQKDYLDVMEDIKRTQAEIAEEGLRDSRRWQDGWSRAFRDYADEATNAAKRAESIFNTATRSMEDEIVNFAKTGKFNLKSVVSDIAEENLRQQIRVIFSKLGGALGGLGGSSSGSSSSGGILDTIGKLFGFGGSSSGAGTLGSTGGIDSISPTNPLPVFVVGGSVSTSGGFNPNNLPATGAGGTSGGILDRITNDIGNVVNGIKNTIGNVIGGVTSTIGNVVNTVKNIPSAIGNVVSGIGNTISTVTNAVKNIPSTISRIGSTVSNVVSGISNFFGGFFATGGKVPSGKFGIVGESGAELVRGPATVDPLNGGAVGMFNITINAVDARSFLELAASNGPGLAAVVMQQTKQFAGAR